MRVSFRNELFLRGRKMIELHPEILEKDGKKEFVILPYEEFLAIQQALADVEDLAALRPQKKKIKTRLAFPWKKSLTTWGSQGESLRAVNRES